LIGSLTAPGIYRTLNFAFDDYGRIYAGLYFTDTVPGGFDPTNSGIIASDENGIDHIIFRIQTDNGLDIDKYYPSNLFSVNQTGGVAFATVEAENSDGYGLGYGRNSSLFAYTPTTGLQRVAGPGDSTADGEFTLTGLYSSDETYGTRPDSRLAINDSGQIAFMAWGRGVSDEQVLSAGLYRYGPGEELIEIARTGTNASDDRWTYSNIHTTTHAINNRGETAYSAILTSTDEEPTSEWALFIADASGESIPIVMPDDTYDGRSFNFLDYEIPALNNNGKVLFTAGVGPGDPGEPSGSGVFIADAVTAPTAIALSGQATPDGDRLFSRFTSWPEGISINDADQVVFRSELTDLFGEDVDEVGLYFYDPVLGIIEIVQTGDELHGGTVERFGFSPGVGGRGTTRSGFNDRGEVAYHFTLEDGRQGIAVWSIPEPGVLAAVSCVGAVVLCRSHRERQTRPETRVTG